jgi:predicted RecB family nuclease
VGEFLNTDPVVIGEKTRVSNEMAENLQATAQLMMVPGLDDDDAELLIDCGVKSRKQLADQDLITLSRKINDLAKIYIAQQKLSKEKAPTIEEISAWIRMAK